MWWEWLQGKMKRDSNPSLTKKKKLDKLFDKVSDYAYERAVAKSKLKKSFYTILLYWCKLRKKIIDKWG